MIQNAVGNVTKAAAAVMGPAGVGTIAERSNRISLNSSFEDRCLRAKNAASDRIQADACPQRNGDGRLLRPEKSYRGTNAR